MALPAELKNFNLFNDGNSLLGVAESVKPPKLAMKSEDYRAGGMVGPVRLDKGLDPLDLEWTCSGFDMTPYKQFGNPKVAGIGLRFAGAYQRADTGGVQAVEITVRGRHTEIDSGEAKAGEGGKTQVKTACSYYKLTVDGKVILEIDMLNFIYIVDGVDLLAEQRKAIGLA